MKDTYLTNILDTLTISKVEDKPYNLVFKDPKGLVIMYYAKRDSLFNSPNTLFIDNTIWNTYDIYFLNQNYYMDRETLIQAVIKKTIFEYLKWRITDSIYNPSRMPFIMMKNITWKTEQSFAFYKKQ
jgi:hypothetical protein